MKAILLSMVALFVGIGAQAADPALIRQAKIELLADHFHQQQYQAQVRKNKEAKERRLGEAPNDHTCACGATCGCKTPPSPTACVEFVCKKLGSFGCDEQAEVIRVVRACRGTYGFACVETVCGKLGSFGCDEIAEIERVAGACRGNVDGECIKFICSKLGSFGCDEIQEIEPIAKECAGL